MGMKDIAMFDLAFFGTEKYESIMKNKEIFSFLTL